MITKKTVLILGAGASVDLGYPTGVQLIDQILEDGSDQILEGSVGKTTYALSQYLPAFYETVNNVQIFNIDTFLRDNPALARDGKTLIGYCLMKNELPITAQMNSFQKLHQTSSWLLYLFNALTRGCTKIPEDLFTSLDNLKIITFNYDLSLEAFFLNQFSQQERYKKYAQELMQRLEVIHVFGQLYSLKDNHGIYSLFQYAERVREVLRRNHFPEIVNQVNAEMFYRAKANINNIHVVGEQKHSALVNSEHIKTARRHLREAAAIHCIGFAFDVDNMSLLREDNYVDWRKKYITFTNYEKSEQLKYAAVGYFSGANELQCSAFEAAANRIAW